MTEIEKYKDLVIEHKKYVAVLLKSCFKMYRDDPINTINKMKVNIISGTAYYNPKSVDMKDFTYLVFYYKEHNRAVMNKIFMVACCIFSKLDDSNRIEDVDNIEDFYRVIDDFFDKLEEENKIDPEIDKEIDEMLKESEDSISEEDTDE